MMQPLPFIPDPPTHDGDYLYACFCWPKPPTWKARWLTGLERWELDAACTKCKERLYLRAPEELGVTE